MNIESKISFSLLKDFKSENINSILIKEFLSHLSYLEKNKSIEKLKLRSFLLDNDEIFKILCSALDNNKYKYNVTNKKINCADIFSFFSVSVTIFYFKNLRKIRLIGNIKEINIYFT